MKRMAIRVAVGLSIPVAIIWVKVYFEGRAAVSAADAALAGGDRDEALTHYRRAIHWYSPLSGSVERAVRSVRKLAEEAESRADTAFALEAWRDLRSSLYAVRHIFIPFEVELRHSEDRIAALASALPPTTAEHRAMTPDDRANAHLALLRKDNAPSVPWSIALLLGFAAWVGGAFYFIFRAVRDNDSLDGRRALYSGFTIVLGFALWVVGLRLA